jgi:tripartite-type tricarboxylate transporter receptor subunit TctC
MSIVIRRTPWLRCAGLLLLTLCLGACGGQGSAGDGSWPTRPLRMILPFGAGGLADVTLRIAGEPLGEALGQPVVIENRPGAGGVAATSTMLAAPPDGHTLIVLTNGSSIAETQFADLPYDITTELRPVSALAWFDLVLLTNPGNGHASLQALLQAAAERPGGLRLGTINPGSTQHLSAELFKARAGVNGSVITYRTTPDVLGALLRGEIDLAVEAYSALKGAIDSGQVRALAVTGEQRNAALPAVPTVAEAGVADYVVTGWNAVYAHAATPDAVVERLNAELAAITAQPEIQQRFRELGVEARGSTPQEIQQRLLADIEKWRAVMQDAGLAPQ